MLRNALLCILLFVPLTMMSQDTGFVIKGRVTHMETGEPVSTVNVYVNETMIGTTTGDDGFFSLKVPDSPAILVFSCVGFTRRYFTLTEAPSGDFNVPLEPARQQIPEVLITGTRDPVSISDKQDLFVSDYDFYDQHIMLLGHPGNKNLETKLLLMDRLGNTLAQTDVRLGINLYRDPFNNLHILTSDTAYQIYFDGDSIQLLYPVKKDRFMKTFPEFLKIYHNKIILRQYAYDDQVLLYYFYNPGDSLVQRFWSQATDEMHRKMKGSMNSIPLTPDGKSTTQFNLFNSDERFIKMAYYAPIFCPLEIIKDTLYIFNFNNGVIEVLGRNGLPVAKSSLMTFHTEEGWQKRLYIDPVTNKAYTEYKRMSKTILREINIHTGYLKPEKIRIPRFSYIKKIMIYDGYLYFLYPERSYPKYQRLFRMRL